MQNNCSLPQRKRFIESSSFYKNECTNPFSGMKIHDSSFLENVPNRSLCPKCNRSRRYYCYTCYVPVEEVSARLPFVNLPVKIDIIKHPKEVDGKSTAAHAAVLAPKDVKIYTYPDFPFYEHEKVLLIFPGKSALPFHEWWIKNFRCNSASALNESDKNEDVDGKPSYNQCLKSSARVGCEDEEQSTLPFSRVIFIDSTWRQSKALYSDPRIRGLPCVLLTSHQSLFWRPQKGCPDTHLATVEAIYYFLVELHNLMWPNQAYSGQYDNLLFFFKFMYCKLSSVYNRPLVLT